LKINRFSAALSILAIGALILSACGGHNNAGGGSTTPTTAPVKVTCGGKPALKASGSTAQKNAMTLFVKAFAQACPGQSLTYTANDSAAGIKDFLDNQTDFGGSDSTLTNQEYDKGRLAGEEPSGGGWTHRHRLPRQRSDFAEPRRPDRGPDLQRPN
jgi:phosphate transport system substrate-binding protein